MNSLRPSRFQQGFSLIEVLIAVVVLSLGLLALASLQSALIRSASDAKAQSLAMAVAKQKIEQLAAVQALGGSDNTCVSPSAWDSTKVSCYRAIDDEAAVAFDGDPAVADVQPLGGIEFLVSTDVTRYVFNVSTSQYGSVNNTALDSALYTTPETFLPGKEFKRIVVTVGWTDPTGVGRSVQVEDAINGIVPRDSLALLVNNKGFASRNAESIITNPGSVAGVIPIAVGNGTNTAASNPTPELLGKNATTYVAETRFDVYTYIPLTSTTALAQSRVETSVVGCRCDTATKSTTEKSLRPTYWNGLRYVIPTQATYAPKAGVAAGGNEQSVQCRVCCRDHHDPSGNDANGDVLSAIAKYSPRRTSHDHYLVNASNGGRTLASSGTYSEACRMIRVDGIFRASADMYNDYFALLPARNTGASSFVPSTLVSDDYGHVVKQYLDARFTAEADTARKSSGDYLTSLYNASNNAPTPAGVNPATYESGTRTLADATSRTYDVSAPAVEYLKLSNDARWLHARGLYIDYLEPEAIDRIDMAKTSCTALDPNECVLPYLPFTSINLSELAEWADIDIVPDPASTGQVISVMNNGFKTAVTDSTLTGDGAGNVGSKEITTTNLDARVTVGMSVSGAGVAPNARIVSFGNSGKVNLDLPNIATFPTTALTFEAAPVRGRVTPGTGPFVGTYSSFGQATASYNNAAVALQFPMHGDETVLTDKQRFDVSAGGAPPDPTAGSFKVTGFSGYTVLATNPGVYWGLVSNGTPSLANSCNLVGATLPFTCSPTSGMGGPMRLLIGSYNKIITKTGEPFEGSAANSQQCHYKQGNSYLAVPSTFTVTGSSNRNYIVNYKITSAVAQDNLAPPTYTVAAGTPYTVVNDKTTVETTELHFSTLAKNDTVTLGIAVEDSPNHEVPAAFVCCEASEVKSQGTVTGYSLNSVTWAPNACPFTPAPTP